MLTWKGETMKKLLIPLILLAIAMVATSIVRHKDELKGLGGGAKMGLAGRDTSDQLYVEVSALGNLDYFYDHKLGMKLAGDVFGVKTKYIGPPDLNLSEMVNAFERELGEPDLKGIVVVGFDPILVPVINKAVEAGIPVVTVDADLPTSKRVAFVGTGNFQAGYEGGMKLASLIGRKGKVALMTRLGQSNLEERIRGYKSALAKFGGIEVVQIVDTQSDKVKAALAAESVLLRHSDLAGLACVEAAGGVGAATAIRERGLIGKVKIVGMDRGNDILELIGEGAIDATVVQQTALMPLYAVQILYHLANVDIPITADNAKAGVPGVPTYVDTGVIIVDKSNYKAFLRK